MAVSICFDLLLKIKNPGIVIPGFVIKIEAMDCSIKVPGMSATPIVFMNIERVMNESTLLIARQV